MEEFTEDSFLQRLTLECGHLGLDGPDGPWAALADIDAKPRWMVGDITTCEVCPRTPPEGQPGYRPGMMLRQIVNVETVSVDQYREPDYGLSRKRIDQLSEMTS